MSAVRFELVDAAGKTHVYLGGLINADQGLPILLRLGSLVVEPIGALVDIDAIAKTFAALDADTKIGDVKLETFLEGVDVGAVAAAAKKSLASPDAAPLIREIIAAGGMTRDGKQLGDPATFNAAYRANYAELFRAAVRIARENRLFPELSTLSIVKAPSAVAASDG
jgi:hypothetical protein